jgi:hypothetical protein
LAHNTSGGRTARSSLRLVGIRLLVFMFFQLPGVDGRPTHHALASGMPTFCDSGGPLGSLAVGLMASLTMIMTSRYSIDRALELGRSRMRISMMILGFTVVLGGLSSFALADTEKGWS